MANSHCRLSNSCSGTTTFRNSTGNSSSLVRIVCLALLPHASVWAADAASPVSAPSEVAQETVRLGEETAYIQALTALQTAKNAKDAAELAPLTALAGDGKTTLGAGAGAIEAWIRTSSALGEAGKLISAKLQASAGDSAVTFLLLAGAEVLSFDIWQATTIEATYWKSHLKETLQAAPACVAAAPVAPPVDDRERSPGLAALGALGSLFKSTTDIAGVTLDASDRVLTIATAMALVKDANAKYSVVLPASAILAKNDKGSLYSNISEARQTRHAAASMATCLTMKPGATPADKEAATKITQVIAQFDLFYSGLTTPDKDGNVKVVRALALDAVAAASDLRVVRVFVDKAGGTLVTKKNVWTAFGAPPVTVSGGLVVSYVETSPDSGKVVSADLISCTTNVATISKVHADSKVAKCVSVGK
jgi:hypothetical protein